MPTENPTPLMRTQPFQSSRLIYRAVEPKTDETFILRLQQKYISWQNFSCVLPKPNNSKTAEASLASLANRLLCVVVCLPGTTPNETTPIGLLSLETPDAARQHHRRALIGLILLDEYQGAGYGSEAIRWSLQWGFESAGLHRVGIECVGWSEGLLRLYMKLGFRLDGTMRDFYWFQGQWWDYYTLSMLEDEWRGMRGQSEDWKAKG